MIKFFQEGFSSINLLVLLAFRCQVRAFSKRKDFCFCTRLNPRGPANSTSSGPVRALFRRLARSFTTNHAPRCGVS